MCTQMHSMGEMGWREHVVVLFRCFHCLRSKILTQSKNGREGVGGFRRRKCVIAGAEHYLPRMGYLRSSLLLCRRRQASHFAWPPLKNNTKEASEVTGIEAKLDHFQVQEFIFISKAI